MHPLLRFLAGFLLIHAGWTPAAATGAASGLVSGAATGAATVGSALGAAPSALVSPLPVAATCVAPGAPSAQAAALAAASARVLAGLPPIGVHGRELSATPFWATHAAEMNQVWRRVNAGPLALWRDFALREIDRLDGARAALYYPFSGPDFVYAHTLFPYAPLYVLVGLEPPGAAPRWDAMTEAQAGASLGQLRQSMASLMRLSFFLTNNMKRDLKRGQLQGVAPLLMAMAARSGFDVHAVDAVHLNAAGALCMGALTGARTNGVRLLLAAPAGSAGMPPPRELVYLNVDLEDKALVNTPGFERYVRSLGAGPVFLKSASYLMHKNYFSASRKLVLERAKLVLQDDSGIPYRAYQPAEWHGRLYGSYAQPIGMFKNWSQPALRAAYQARALPLDTGIGYSHRRGTSNLQLFERRAPTVAARAAILTQKVPVR